MRASIAFVPANDATTRAYLDSIGHDGRFMLDVPTHMPESVLCDYIRDKLLLERADTTSAIPRVCMFSDELLGHPFVPTAPPSTTSSFSATSAATVGEMADRLGRMQRQSARSPSPCLCEAVMPSPKKTTACDHELVWALRDFSDFPPETPFVAFDPVSGKRYHVESSATLWYTID